MHRIAFDPALPVVAACPFMAAGRPFASGEAVDWRSLGIDERMLFDWWQAGQVSFVEASKVEPKDPPAPTPPERRTPPNRKHRR